MSIKNLEQTDPFDPHASKGSYRNPIPVGESKEAAFIEDFKVVFLSGLPDLKVCQTQSGEWYLVPDQWFTDHPFTRAQEVRIKQILLESIQQLSKG